MIICLGPVCVPVNVLLPALVVLANQRGWVRAKALLPGHFLRGPAARC